MPDTTIGDYEIGTEIGRGSFATVYKGRHMHTRNAVAIKSVLRSKLTTKLLDNLESEIAIMKNIKQAHIVELIDCQKSHTYIHLIMEYCALGDLSYFIKKRDRFYAIPAVRDIPILYPNTPQGGLNEHVVRHFLQQIASALSFLRQNNLMHRDLKPQNLLLQLARSNKTDAVYAGSPDLPVLKIADFGFARSLPSTSLAETLCGSPLYMAPEILRYEKYNASADLWSVGTVAYEMISGRPPFRAQNHVELLRKIEKSGETIKFPDEIGGENVQSMASPELKDLIKGLLKKSPQNRMTYHEFFAHTVITTKLIPAKIGPISSPKKQDETGSTPYIGDYIPPSSTSQISASARVKQPSPVPEQHLMSPDSRQLQLPKNGATTEYVSNVRQVTPPSSVSGSQMMPILTTTSRYAPDFGRKPSDIRQGHVSAAKRSSNNSSNTSHRSSPLENAEIISYELEEDSAIEQDYVILDKRNIEVNALADEFAHTPGLLNPRTLHSNQIMQKSKSYEVTGFLQQPQQSRSNVPFIRPSHFSSLRSATSLPVAKPLSPSPSRYSPLAASPTSALAKAINLATVALWGNTQSLRSTRSKSQGDSRQDLAISSGDPVEDCIIAKINMIAKRSYSIYCYAEFKLSQIMNTDSSEPPGLSPGALVMIAQEAVVLYVKALSLLQRSMEIVGQHWATRPIHRPASNQLNHAVQSIRTQFNSCLERAEVARNLTNNSIASVDAFNVTAEKLIYDRALEMSRAAAKQELLGENLESCVNYYELSTLMLEALLEPWRNDDITEQFVSSDDMESRGEMDEEDRDNIENFIRCIRKRVDALRSRLDYTSNLKEGIGYADGTANFRADKVRD